MGTMKVYVAAPYADAQSVVYLHERMRTLGIEPTSLWATQAEGAENLTALSREEVQAIAASNYADIARSTSMIVLAREGVGGEMFREFGYALDVAALPLVCWVGRRILSAYDSRVTLCEDLDEAIQAVLEWRGA